MPRSAALPQTCVRVRVHACVRVAVRMAAPRAVACGQAVTAAAAALHVRVLHACLELGDAAPDSVLHAAGCRATQLMLCVDNAVPQILLGTGVILLVTSALHVLGTWAAVPSMATMLGMVPGYAYATEYLTTYVHVGARASTRPPARHATCAHYATTRVHALPHRVRSVGGRAAGPLPATAAGGVASTLFVRHLGVALRTRGALLFETAWACALDNSAPGGVPRA